MDWYPGPGPTARRPFIISQYRTDPTGRWAPELPVRCPLGIGAAEACDVHIDHFRPRKTGPRHPVLVARCGTHEVGFTVYPSGHVPYGRIAVAPVGDPVATLTAPGTALLAEAVPAAAPREPTRGPPAQEA